MAGLPFGVFDGAPTFTKEKRRRKLPSVRTLKSCKINQIPFFSDGSVRRNALADRLPIRLRVNMPDAVGETGTTAIRWTFGSGAVYKAVSPALGVFDAIGWTDVPVWK